MRVSAINRSQCLTGWYVVRRSMNNTASIYFKRFECRPPLITFPLPSQAKIIVVIPCYNEPHLLTTLHSLHACDPPRYPVEVIVVVNEAAQAPADVTRRNQQTVAETHHWTQQHGASLLGVQVIYVDDLPPKHAGVGLARKIGMDEALRRFVAVDYDGWIVCLDADCEVAENYLTVLEQEFLEHTPNSATVYFEHRLSSINDAELRQGIIHYELFLRYYVNGLRYAEFPYAMHTVGSSMAVRATVYARTGGMNRRKAGEDFYFLHKVAPHGGLRQITKTVVYPSARVSQRVPFGTGRAQAEWLRGERRPTYHPTTFEELKTFFSFVSDEYGRSEQETRARLSQLPLLLQHFLQENQYVATVEALKASTSLRGAFERRFFAWFDGFMVLKYVHYVRGLRHSEVPLQEAAVALLAKRGEAVRSTEEEVLLRAYRLLDRADP